MTVSWLRSFANDRGGEYYGNHGETRQFMGPFAKYLQDCGIVA